MACHIHLHGSQATAGVLHTRPTHSNQLAVASYSSSTACRTCPAMCGAWRRAMISLPLLVTRLKRRLWACTADLDTNLKL